MNIDPHKTVVEIRSAPVEDHAMIFVEYRREILQLTELLDDSERFASSDFLELFWLEDAFFEEFAKLFFGVLDPLKPDPVASAAKARLVVAYAHAGVHLSGGRAEAPGDRLGRLPG